MSQKTEDRRNGVHQKFRAPIKYGIRTTLVLGIISFDGRIRMIIYHV